MIRSISLAVASLVLCALVTTGCWKPYEKPVYEEVDTNETAFLIDLDDTGKQAAFDSAEKVKEKKVAAKRVRISLRWSKTGRMPGTGEYIPTVKLIKISRAPATRTWTADAGSGTDKKDQAVWVESMDSVGFSVGITCTALVMETDTALFLYTYGGNQLEKMMDTEVLAQIQQSLGDECAEFGLDELRTKKGEIMKAAREKVIPFFKERGVTITALGMVGGLAYENQEIQEAIDRTVQDQQLKVSAEAKREAQIIEANTKQEAQEITNKTNIDMALAEATAKKNEAMGLADAKVEEARGESDAKKQIANARAEAIVAVGGPEAYIRILELENVKAQIEQWDGKYPTWYMGSTGQTPSMLLQVPTTAISDAVKNSKVKITKKAAPAKPAAKK
jgi:hypothetical protein